MAESASPPFRVAFDRTARLSQYVARVANARPHVVDDIERRAAAPFSREEIRAALASPDGSPLATRLRRVRERVMVCLAHRDLNALASLDEVFATMDALAEECIRAAATAAHAAAVETHGESADGEPLVVAALGKLGGSELNVSSDVDLVFLYHAEGETRGGSPVPHREFHATAGRHLIALLAEPTEDGFAFRVDMRLRPFGDSGPLATSFAALEDYFIAHARAWERYAWLKARVVSGRANGLAERVQPFVYRRYLDYGMLEALRELHARIFEAAIRRRKSDDIKVGAGGIREIEFIVQLFQMIRGGRDALLRTTSTRSALQAVAQRSLIEPARARAVGEAYEFLRRLEHRLQYYDDQQTQALPRGDGERALIAESMGFPDWEGLAGEIARHRRLVEETFDALFEAPPSHERATSLASSLTDPQAPPEADGLAAELAEAGIVDAGEVASRLVDFIGSKRFQSHSASIRAKLEKLLPALVSAVADAGGHASVAERLIAILEAIDRREAYYALLIEHPRVLHRVAQLAAKSRWAARLIARHPILLDDLMQPPTQSASLDWAAERDLLRRECAAIVPDIERLLDHLRHFKQRHTLRLVVEEIERGLPVMALSDELSALADTILDVTLERAVGVELGSHPSGGDEAHRAFAGLSIVGYGKLGGKELGYGSDLDIIFLYDEESTLVPDRLARIAQRVNTWLTSLTSAGVLYETDLRLRPDGASGLLVSSLSAFRDYQEKRAWTWEHQALTRARACAGDRPLGAKFEQARDAILAEPRDSTKVLADIIAMRRKMQRESRTRQGTGDLKQVEGGVIDLEFAVQALVLTHGAAHPELRENKGNHTLLKRAGEAGIIDASIAETAAQAYLAMRQRAHAAALNDEDGVRLSEGELAAEREAVKRLWSAVFG